MLVDKYAFSPIGVLDWQTDLYAQPESVIQEEALAADTDFKSWLTGRFELDQEQITFADSIAPVILSHWGSNIAYFIGQKLPIILEKPEKPTPTAGQQLSRKLVTSDEKVPSSEVPRDVESGAVLTFHITY